MALIQINVDDDVKKRADQAFARSGLTTPYAMRILVNQVANTGVTPFDGMFAGSGYQVFSERLHRDMLAAEAQEYGLLPDDSLPDPTEVPDDVLGALGIAPDEVGQ
mgnify:CR=1 FL=1